MRLCPKYTRAKEEGRQGSGSLISTFSKHCCRPRELLSAGNGDELFRVLKMLLENIHRFLHQPLALIAEHVILVHKFLDNDNGPLQQGTSLLLLVCTSEDLLPQQVALGWSFSLPSLSCRMTQVAYSNEAFMSSCNLTLPEI